MKRLSTILACLVLFWLLPQQVAAQTGTIEGQVVDAANDRPLPGVNVVIQQLMLGAATDVDGNYSIEGVPAGDHQVVVRFIGYQTVNREVSVQAGETVTLNFALEEAAIGLDEVVVTGTGGEVQRRSLGHTVSSIEFADVEFHSSTSITDALTGREPGVNIQTQSAVPGQEPRIRIRGTSSISMTNEPLVYVNGVRIESRGGFAPGISAGGLGAPSALANINFEAVERVEILKGPAAATLYGSQANAGVIQIFTSRGEEEQPPQFNLNVSSSAYQMPNRFKRNAGFVETAEEQQRVRDILGIDVGLYEPFESPIQLIDLYSMGVGQDISASVRGGGRGMTYFANTRYNYTDGPYSPRSETFNGGDVGNSNDLSHRFFFSGNLNLIPSDNFFFNIQSSYTYADYGVYATGITIYTPTSSARYAKPERVGMASEFETFGLPIFATPREGTFYEVADTRHTGRVVLQGNYLPTETLTLDATVGLDYTESRSRDYAPFGYAVDGIAPGAAGSLVIGNRSNLVLSLESKANWAIDVTPAIRSNFVTGFQAYRRSVNTSTASGDNFPGPGLETLNATAIQTTGSSFLEVVDAGLFAQEQLNYNDYLYFTAGIRLDASSAFGDLVNYATYPKVAVSFLPLDAFQQEIGGVSTLRLRAAWGQSGQQPGAFDAFTTFNPVSSPDGSGVVPGNLGNPDLKPEVASEWEAGFDLGFFDERLIVGATYWDRVTRDALINRGYAPSGGFSTPQLTNAATLVGRGLEFDAEADVIEGEDFSMNVFANAAYTYERVESLGGAPPIKVEPGYVRSRMYVREGYAPGAYFGAALPAGVDFPFDLERDGQPSGQAALEAFFSQPRDPTELVTYLMVAGPDGLAMAGGETYGHHYLGKPVPDWEGSFGARANFLGNFTLSTRFQYAFGNYWHHNLTDAFRRTNSGIGRNIIESASLEAILKNPASTPQERIDAAQQWVTRMISLSPVDGLNEIERADYLRWQNLSLSYNIPANVAGQFGVTNASVTFSGNNIALWSRYGGVDPTATGSASSGANGGIFENFAGGMDTYGTPVLRSYTISLRVGF